MPCNACQDPARCDAAGLCQEYRGEMPRAPVLSDAQIDAMWLLRSNIHGGELMPQLRDFARAVMGAAGVKEVPRD